MPPPERRYDSSEPYPGTILMFVGMGLFAVGLWIAHDRFFLTGDQLVELTLLGFLAVAAVLGTGWVQRAQKRKRATTWPKPPLVIAPSKAAKDRARAAREDSIVLGYDDRRRPWRWSDHARTMQTILFGTTGSGKTTLLKSIVAQDIYRRTPDGRALPMVILDGKGDRDFLDSLIPHVHRAGRLHQFRMINPSLPEWSVGYNPFLSNDEDYNAQVNMIFGSFNLHDEFFAKHQLNYLADIVRVLFYTRKRFNFYDVIVMALDQNVLEEQCHKAKHELSKDKGIALQKRLNFEMSVKNLFQSLRDRERVPKIQGLLNECMTFLDDELSVITLPYDDVLSLDEVFDDQLILFISLNTNKNTEPVVALGKMLLQNIQLMIGKRYSDPAVELGDTSPLFSVVMDEFAAFGYDHFAQTLNTARATKTAMLFSIQSLPQLLKVSRGFMQDVSSSPNTTLCMRTRDPETCEYMRQASAQQRVERRSLTIARRGLFDKDSYQSTGRGTVMEVNDYRLSDQEIKYLPKGQVHVLQSDDTRGMVSGLLHVAPLVTPALPGYEPLLYRRPLRSRKESKGAYLRPTDPVVWATVNRELPKKRKARGG